jgi:hypothetical protein
MSAPGTQDEVPALARDLQLSLTAAGLLGTLHLIGYLISTLASPWLNVNSVSRGCNARPAPRTVRCLEPGISANFGINLRL